MPSTQDHMYGWARETDLREECALCQAKYQEANWFACDHDQRAFPRASMCPFYKPLELDGA